MKMPRRARDHRNVTVRKRVTGIVPGTVTALSGQGFAMPADAATASSV
jgi:hypothetical protein